MQAVLLELAPASSKLYGRWKAVATDVVTAAGLGCVGDLMCQLGAEGRRLPSLSDIKWRSAGEVQDEQVFDARRLASLTAFNGAYIGGVLHLLYQYYPTAVRMAVRASPLPLPLRMRLTDGSSPAHALGCAVVDSAHNATMYIPAFFLGVGMLQGDKLADAAGVLRREWFETYAWCSVFWVPFTFANFALVPAAGRVKAMAAANLAWASAIDFLAHRG